jgi:hypothetical protein
MRNLILLVLVIFTGVSAFGEVSVKKVDKERQEMIKQQYLGTGVGEAKAQADANYGTQQNVSEIGAAFDAFAKRIQEESLAREAQRRAEEGPDAAEIWASRPKGPVITKSANIGTWQAAAATSLGMSLREYSEEDKEEHD